MFKIIFMILIVLFLYPECYSQEKPFGYKISGNGDIISDVFIIQEGYVLDSATNVTLNRTYKFEYNNDGKLKSDFNFIMSTVTIFRDGRTLTMILPGYRDYFYNELGDIDSIGTRYWYDSAWIVYPGYKINYSYDSDGRILSKSYSNNDVVTRTEENIYDSSGNLILNKIILNGYDTTYTVREYDPENRLTLLKSFHGSIPFTEQYIYKYDSCGNVDCTFQNNSQEEFRNIFNHRLIFDETGKMQNEIKSRIFDPADSLWTDSLNILFVYDEYNKISKMGDVNWFRYTSDGNLDTLAYLHPQDVYLENRAILVDSYGNRLKLPDYSGITKFYYSRLDGNLPVELTSFSAAQTGSVIRLEWNTATEINNLGFDIEKQIAKDTKYCGWEKIAFINGHGTTSENKSYIYDDKNIENSATSVRYRLKQIDYDGTFKYSNIAEIGIKKVPNEFSLKQNFPNPFNPVTTIKYSLPKSSRVTLKVYDLLGREIATLVNGKKSAGNYTVDFNAGSLPSGIYLYRIQAQNFTSTRKFVLLK